ncbi:MAG: DUF4424 domain-containing protein [Proteobacteria bacterium]|nr:DUF4424 domain-containing protein [Pseudomonadota bacterium]
MKIGLMAAFGAVCLWLAPAALADDSEAELGIGGLHFTQNAAIQMVSEDLYLSMDQVRIRYVFRNRTNRDVTIRVGFPLPDILPDYYFEPVAFPNRGDPNFVNFETRADGQLIPMQVEQHARLNGADVTARVRAAGLPLSPIDPHFDDAVARLSAASRADLMRAHLMENLSEGDRNNPPEYRALWSLATAYSRMQTFPAGRDITVEQRYTPVAGGSVETVLLANADYPEAAAERRRLVQDYCIDATFERAARQTMQRYGGAEFVQERRLSYVLRTGANWAGPIGRFHLTVDKGAAQNLVSLCAPDIRHTTGTLFELTRTNYTPREDIHVLLLTPQRAN